MEAVLTHVVALSERGIERDRPAFDPPGDSGGLRRTDDLVVRIAAARPGEGPATVYPRPRTGRTCAGGGRPRNGGTRRGAPLRPPAHPHRSARAVLRGRGAGDHIAADQGRLDFAIDMRWLDATRIERELNALFERDVVTETAWITDAELNAQPG